MAISNPSRRLPTTTAIVSPVVRPVARNPLTSRFTRSSNWGHVVAPVASTSAASSPRAWANSFVNVAIEVPRPCRAASG